MADFIGDFVQGPPVDRDGRPLRLDLLLVYDLEQLRGIQIPGMAEPEPSTYRFVDPAHRIEAVVALIRLLPDPVVS